MFLCLLNISPKTNNIVIYNNPSNQTICTSCIQVTVEPYGSSNIDQKIDYTMVLGASVPASPTTGSLGGPSIVLQGKYCLDIQLRIH